MQYLEKVICLHLTEEAFDTGFYLFKTTIGVQPICGALFLITCQKSGKSRT